MKFLSSPLGLIIAALVIVAAGVGTAYSLSGRGRSSGPRAIPNAIQTDTETGVQDTSQFPDSAQGVLESGGINGEGTHHLVRDGGPSQTVYVFSSIVNLDEFVGKKVEVWGQTFDGSRAGWLMDVGLVKILE